MRLPVFPAVYCPDMVPAVSPAKNYHHHIRLVECMKCQKNRGKVGGYQHCGDGPLEAEETIIFLAVECPDRAGAVFHSTLCEECYWNRGGDGDSQLCVKPLEPEPDMDSASSPFMGGRR